MSRAWPSDPQLKKARIIEVIGAVVMALGFNSQKYTGDTVFQFLEAGPEILGFYLFELAIIMAGLGVFIFGLWLERSYR